jgi:peptidoglycan hydrolase-like protein with peptidoglycan-binding domain
MARRRSRLPAIVLVLALALAAPLASTAPVTALGETLADLSTGLLTGPDSRFGPHHRFASRPLAAGARGTDVAALQRFLTGVGLVTPVTGRYGPATRASVERWRAWRGARRDGTLSVREARRIREQARPGGRRDVDGEVRPSAGAAWPGQPGGRVALAIC